MAGGSTIRRRLATWFLGCTLVALAVLAITRVVFLREELAERAASDVESALERRVKAWEATTRDTLHQWVEVAADRIDRPKLVQSRLKETPQRYIEALYIWAPSSFGPPDSPPSENRARLLFPPTHPFPSARQVLGHPCMIGASMIRHGGLLPTIIADSYSRGCADAPPYVRVEAAMRAASTYREQGDISGALRMLENAGLPEPYSLEQGMADGVMPERLVFFYNIGSNLLVDRGNEGDRDRAIAQIMRVGNELAELDAPDAALLDNARWVLLEGLRQTGAEDEQRELEARFRALERRTRAYREVISQILPSARPPEARFVQDQYADRPYVLFYDIVANSRSQPIGVALQLNEEALLGDFLKSAGDLEDDLVIEDTRGQHRMGASDQSESLAITVPFSTTLSHLRVGLYASAIEARAARRDEQWVLPLVLTLILVTMAFWALTSQVRAQRRLRGLLERQGEFTRRVTHELKTPIAGIKIMAENLELGALPDEDAKRRAARRIVDEADRLTARIEEVLSNSKQRQIPDPEIFDLEEVIYALIDLWGPRMSAAGIHFEADIDIAPEVMGDPAAVRDAIGCLLDNALKYRDAEKEQSSVSLQLCASPNNRFARVIVADNGLGVPAERRQDIFEEFVRIEGPNRGLSGGHGLGLAQVARVVNAHKGTVRCTESDEGGAKFTIQLPAHIA